MRDGQKRRKYKVRGRELMEEENNILTVTEITLSIITAPIWIPVYLILIMADFIFEIPDYFHNKS